MEKRSRTNAWVQYSNAIHSTKKLDLVSGTHFIIGIYNWKLLYIYMYYMYKRTYVRTNACASQLRERERLCWFSLIFSGLITVWVKFVISQDRREEEERGKWWCSLLTAKSGGAGCWLCVTEQREIRLEYCPHFYQRMPRFNWSRRKLVRRQYSASLILHFVVWLAGL